MRSEINSNYVKLIEIKLFAGHVWASFSPFSIASLCFGYANGSLLFAMIFDILALRKVKRCMGAFECG